MKPASLLLALTALLASCAWLRSPRHASLEGDGSIGFPDFYEHSAIEVGAGEQPYELDGVLLRAILIATQDFLPPPERDQPCRDRPEAHRYRVIRRGEVIFVQIEDDDEFCGLKYLSLDTGARYAISTDGRILRRSMGAEPELPEQQDGGSSPSSTPDGGPLDTPDASSSFRIPQ